VTSTFPIYPPQGGGQARIFNLYKQLAKRYDVEVVTFTEADRRHFDGYISDSFREIRIPKSAEHQKKEWEKYESKVGVPVSDIAMLSLSGYTPEYGKRLEASIAGSDTVVISHPYLYTEAKKYLRGKKFVYEAHNVESEIKKNILPDAPFAKNLFQELFEAEKACCEECELIMTCSLEDKETLAGIYGVGAEKISVVPNGVDCSQTRFTDLNARTANKKALGLGAETIGLFMGSWHGPNLEACEKIIEFAPKCPDVRILFMGSQCLYFSKRTLPANIGLLGVVSEEVKNRVFSAVDFAVNPMLSGSGTNLKMFDYMAAGIPVITTEFGARGIDRKTVFHITEIDDMADAVNAFRLPAQEQTVNDARRYVEEEFDWAVIAQKLVGKLDELIGGSG
jgi:glycosyltransferase involved in cell wall biosynthesis